MNAREAEILEAYRQLILRIGPGFHPDTSYGAYEPPIDFINEDAFEALMDEVFGLWITVDFDPYEFGLSVGRIQGLVVTTVETAGAV